MTCLAQILPEASTSQIGIAAVIFAGFLASTYYAIEIVRGFLRKPPLEAQFVEHEEHLAFVKASEHQHELLWGEIRKNQADVAGMNSTLQAQSVSLLRIETKLDRNIERNNRNDRER